MELDEVGDHNRVAPLFQSFPIPMTDDKEIVAISICTQAFEDLNDAERVNVSRYLASRYDRERPRLSQFDKINAARQAVV